MFSTRTLPHPTTAEIPSPRRAPKPSSSLTRKPPPYVRLATWSADHPRWALLVWAVLIAVTFSISMFADTRQATELEMMTGESQRAAILADEAGYVAPATELILIRGDASPQTAQHIQDELAATPHVDAVHGPVQEGGAMLFQVELSGDPETAADRVGPLAATTEMLADAHPQLDISRTGDVSITEGFQTWLGDELDRAMILTLVLTLIILLVVFGAVFMALLPVAVGAAAVLSALGLWATASQLVPDQGIVPHVIALIGLAVGIDYALFYSRRYREEVHALESGRQGEAHRDRTTAQIATEIAARTAGHSILVSGTAVSLAMAGLFFLGETIYTGIAIGAILVVLVAMASAVTAMPALMRLLHRFIDRPRIPFVWRITGREIADGRPNPLGRILHRVARRPWLALGATLLILAMLAAPAVGMRLTNTTIDDFPRAFPAMTTYDEVLDAFPDNSSSVTVVLRADEAGDASADGGTLTLGAGDLAEAVGAHPELFGAVGGLWQSPAESSAQIVVMTIPVPHETTSPGARDALETLRSDVLPDLLAAHPDIESAVGGPIAANVDASASIAQKMPWVIGIVVSLTFLFMLVTYRSFAVAGITVVLNIASTLASFGILMFIFQGSWAEDALGFTSNGGLVSWVPLLLFVVVSGLSLDYHVLVLGRVREFAVAGFSARDAVIAGLSKTAGMVTAAAAIMIVVFAVFGSMSFIELKQIGVGLAIATLLDVTLVRVVALPAALLAFRRQLWWKS
ncbi:MMPL family transporter [Gulosibacter molinativorax]|nr:MMPL family transporter [Gulosibacter molinativorax]QUY61986.1 Cation diffusion facilitator family transporter [Gulosibacter molinativorax]